MIRFATGNDITQLKKLWMLVFGDSSEAVDMFLKAHFKPENTVVFDENNKIISAFYLIEGNAVFDNKLYPSYYLYAACTDPGFRGRGIMAELISYAAKAARERKFSFIFLLPAEESLYGYYERFGFKALYSNRSVTIKASENVETEKPFIETDFDSDLLFNLRKKAYSPNNYFEWNPQQIEFAFDFNKFYGGESLVTCNGYLLYTKTEAGIVVKECTFTDFDYSQITANLHKEFSCDEITFSFPCGYSDLKEKHGMALPLDSQAAEMLENNNNFSLNLTLE